MKENIKLLTEFSIFLSLFFEKKNYRIFVYNLFVFFCLSFI